MKLLILILSVALSFLTPMYAALSPLNQSLSDLKSVLDSNELNKHLPQNEAIQFIYHVDTGYWLITNNYQLFVEMQPLEQTRIGPKTYHIIYHQPIKVTS